MYGMDCRKTKTFQSALLNIVLNFYFQNRLRQSDIQFHLDKYIVKCEAMFHKKKKYLKALIQIYDCLTPLNT